MITINWAKDGTSGSREFANQNVADRFAAGLVRTGYTIAEDAPEAPVSETRQTGRVGNGTQVHVIIEGHAKCGASYRKGHSFRAVRKVRLTGEVVTCKACCIRRTGA